MGISCIDGTGRWHENKNRIEALALFFRKEFSWKQDAFPIVQQHELKGGQDLSEPVQRFWQIFFELYESLPRQGPGNRACAAKALSLCDGLRPSPTVLDLGCGVGEQTFYLAEMTGGTVVAVDNHEPFIEKLRAEVAKHGFSGRIVPLLGDMADAGLPPGSFDLIWSEGALYNIGIQKALEICRKLLRPGGYAAFTDAVWRKENPPREIKESFDLDYPAMGSAEDILEIIDVSGFSLKGNFLLPDEAWLEDFYTPMEERLSEMKQKYGGDEEALAVLRRLASEPEMHRKYSEYYAYVFFVAQRID
jgi:SAM-dependent methyltransferase